MFTKKIVAPVLLTTVMSIGSFASAGSALAGTTPGSTLVIRGSVQGITNPGPTETLNIKVGHRRSYNVTLASTTSLISRNGTTEPYTFLIPGDILAVTGTVTTPASVTLPGVLAPTTASDLSLVQTKGIVGRVTSLPNASQIVIVTGRRTRGGFESNSKTFTVDVTSSTPVSQTEGVTTTASLADVVPGTVLSAAGLADIAAHTVVNTTSIQLLSGTTRCHGLNCYRHRSILDVRLLATPLTSTLPQSLAARIVNGPAISITVATTSSFFLRYDGKATISDFVKGDYLTVTGSFDSAQSAVFDAAKIKNRSTQEASTGALLKISSFTYVASSQTATGIATVIIRMDKQAPFALYRTITLSFDSATSVLHRNGSAGLLADLNTLSYVQVMGRYDRIHHSLYVVRAQE